MPSSTWDAIIRHIRDPADAARLADSAGSRLLYRYAIALYRHAADAGDEAAASRLADLLAERGDLDELRALADTGSADAASRLADLLAERRPAGPSTGKNATTARRLTLLMTLMPSVILSFRVLQVCDLRYAPGLS